MTRLLSSLALAATVFVTTISAACAASEADSLRPIFVKLAAVGGSGQSGRLVMRQLGPQFTVSGTVANESPQALEPSHIHKGPCGSNAPIIRDLGAVTRGNLGTALVAGYTIAQLHAMHASIDVHTSAGGRATVVACGNM